MAELIQYPDFNPTKLNALKAKEQPSFIEENNLGIANRISDHLFGLDHQYDQVKLDSIHCSRYFNQTYQPNKCLLVIVGAVDSKKMVSQVQEKFAFWKIDSSQVSHQDSLILLDSLHSPRFIAHYSESTDPAYIKILVPLILKQGGQSVHFAEMLNTILGGHPKSRLNEKLRVKEGFSYGLLSRLLYLPNGHSYLSIQGGINGNQVDTAVTTILKEVEKLRQKTVKSKELALAKKIAVTNFSRKLQRIENVVDMLYQQWNYNFPPTFHSSFIDSLKSINSVDLMEAANAMFQPDSSIIITVGNKAPLEAQLLHLSDTNLVLYTKNGEPSRPITQTVPDDLTPQKIFKKYLDAVGSGMPVDSIKSISTKWISQINDAKVELKMRIKKPHHLLIEVFLDGEPVSITIFNKELIWSKDLAGVSLSKDSSIIEQYRQQALIFPETSFDSTYTLKGIEIVKGISAYRIESNTGNIYHYDTDHYFKVQTSLKGKRDQRITQFFSNYKRVKDIRYPHTAIVNGLAGWPLQFRLQEIEINPILPNAIFEIPIEKNE